MSSIPYNAENGKEISGSVTNFMTRFQIGKLLFKCNAGKAKGIPVIEVFRYLFCLIFSDRSMYMQWKTGIFDGSFCKNTVYRFLNNAKINWSRFTTLLSSRIISDFMKPLTDESRKDVFIIDDSLFDRSRSNKTELLAKVFDHCSMKYKRGYRMLLFDSWFPSPKTITALKTNCELDTIAMVKKSSKIKYGYQGGRYSIKEIYKQCRKRRGRSKYLLSIDVTVGDGAIEAKIVCIRNKSKKKDWLAIISTDTTLSEEEIIRIYGKRWDIEVFFKTCKSYLHLVKECRSLSYDALTAHVSIVFARYMMLAVTQRCNTDDKTICELFFCLMDELDDITFSQSMRIIIDALMGVVMEYFHITEQQLEKFTASFVQRLPKYMQKALEFGSAAA